MAGALPRHGVVALALCSGLVLAAGSSLVAGSSLAEVAHPSSERIPPGARVLHISVSSTIKSNQPKQKPLTVSAAAKIARIAALIDALPAEQPGLRACPADFGIRVRLAFYRRRGAAPLAVANDDPGGCGVVDLTIEGKAEQPLEGGAQLVQGVDRVLGVRLDTTPPGR